MVWGNAASMGQHESRQTQWREHATTTPHMLAKETIRRPVGLAVKPWHHLLMTHSLQWGYTFERFKNSKHGKSHELGQRGTIHIQTAVVCPLSLIGWRPSYKNASNLTSEVPIIFQNIIMWKSKVSSEMQVKFLTVSIYNVYICFKTSYIVSI